MSEWPMVKLGEVISRVDETEQILKPEDETFVTLKLHGKGVVPRNIGDGKTPKSFRGFRVKLGQFIYSRIDARNGAFGIIPAELDGAVVSKDFPVYEVDSAEIMPSILISICTSEHFVNQIRSMSNGATNRQRIKEDVLEHMLIPLPPLGEQKRIAEILGGVANAIHTVEQQIEAANQLEKSLFNQFRRQYSALCSPIKNICKVQTGATPSRKNSAYYDGGIPWVKTGEVNGGKIEETEEYITEFAVQETNCRKFPIGTILVAMYGQGATRGKVGILNCTAATNQACAALIALACEDQEYIFAVLRNCYDELRNLGRGGTQPNLNLTLVKEFEIPWPEEFAREEFSQKWRELDNLRHLLHRKLSLLQELQKSLATRAFAGLL